MYLGKEGVHDQVEEATEHLVTNKDGHPKVTQDDGGWVMHRVCPFAANRQDKSDEVDGHYERKKFTTDHTCQRTHHMPAHDGGLTGTCCTIS
jgi:hypothetical protein